MNFFLSEEVLYKRNYDMTLLRCVDASEAKIILEEVHEGVCETQNGHIMASQIMHADYNWLTMESDCIKYGRKCHKCQMYTDKIHAPTFPLHVLIAP